MNDEWTIGDYRFMMKDGRITAKVGEGVVFDHEFRHDYPLRAIKQMTAVWVSKRAMENATAAAKFLETL